MGLATSLYYSQSAYNLSSKTFQFERQASVIIQEKNIKIDSRAGSEFDSITPYLSNVGASDASNIKLWVYDMFLNEKGRFERDEKLVDVNDIFSSELLINDLRPGETARFGQFKIEPATPKGAQVVLIFTLFYIDTATQKEECKNFFYQYALGDPNSVASLISADFKKIDKRLLETFNDRLENQCLLDFIRSRSGLN